jgi:uncharacterized membrane protein YebE (DUF533 family)
MNKTAKKLLTTAMTVSLVVATVALNGCGYFRKQEADVTGWTKVCVDGVTYLQFPHGVTPQRTMTHGFVSCN